MRTLLPPHLPFSSAAVFLCSGSCGLSDRHLIMPTFTWSSSLPVSAGALRAQAYYRHCFCTLACHYVKIPRVPAACAPARWILLGGGRCPPHLPTDPPGGGELPAPNFGARYAPPTASPHYHRPRRHLLWTVGLPFALFYTPHRPPHHVLRFYASVPVITHCAMAFKDIPLNLPPMPTEKHASLLKYHAPHLCLHRLLNCHNSTYADRYLQRPHFGSAVSLRLNTPSASLHYPRCLRA